MNECRMTKFKFLLLLAVSIGLTFSACSSHSKQKHLTRGEDYLQKRKFEEAVMEFRAAADIDKTSADAHWGMARALENLGRFTETIDELRQIADLNPENLEAKTKLGTYLLAGQPPQIQETERILADVFARDANFIEAHVLKAGLFAAQKKSATDILNVLNHAVALDPSRTASYISLSRFYMKLDRRQEDETTIEKGIAANPNAAAGYLEYGRFLTFSARLAPAEAQYKKAVEVEPTNVEAREAIAQFYLGNRRLDQAEQAYKELVQVEANSSASRTKLANFYAAVGREDDAIVTFNEIIRETPEYARARYRLAEIYLDRRESAKVYEQTEELLKSNDDDIEAFMLRARVKIQENKADEAVKDLEEVLKKQPSQKNALFYMAQARLALGQTEQARAFIGDLEKYHPGFLKTKLLKIQASFTSGEPANALRQSNELLDAVKKSYPTAELDAQGLEELRIRALTARGLANLELGKIVEARSDLQTVRNLSPNSAAAMVNLAKVFVAEKNPSEAVNLYEKALAGDSRNFDALNGLINVLVRQKQFDRAHTIINQAFEINAALKDTQAGLHYLNANVFAAQKNTEASEAELKKAIEIDDAYLPAYSAYAAMLAARNQINEAVGQYEKIVERKPSASVHTLIAMLEEARSKPSEAEKHYRKALELQPNVPIAANNLAWLLAENQGNLDEALALSQSVINGNQTVAGYYDTLGWIYYKKNLYSPAVEQLKKAVTLDEAGASKSGLLPNSAYRLRLGMALASAGDKSSARREVEISLQKTQSLSERELRDAKNLLANL